MFRVCATRCDITNFFKKIINLLASKKGLSISGYNGLNSSQTNIAWHCDSQLLSQFQIIVYLIFLIESLPLVLFKKYV